MSTQPGKTVLDEFANCWEGFEDPRTGNAGLHDFHELLMIALCTVLCGGQSAVDMGLFARAKEPFLRGFLTLANGLRSHDTFSRLFRLLDPTQFQTAFQRFMVGFTEQCQGVVAIDGKVLRRSFDQASGKSALPMVSAWGCEQRMVLAQIATDAKSNEITAVPELLRLLSLKGTIVTTDAMNCQRTIAQQIVDQGGDYVLALKANQGSLHDDVRTYLDHPAASVITAGPCVDADHGRIETRTATVCAAIGWLDAHRWPGLAAIGEVLRTRETKVKIATETPYYLLSSDLSPERFNDVVRSHWGVENRLRWRLDVVMHEDQDRSRLGHAPESLALLRHMALNVTQKGGTRAHFAASSSAPDGRMPIWPNSSHCSEVRLPWRWLPLLLLLAPIACNGPRMPDVHVPPFAKVPFEPFFRDAAVAIALREWRLFGQHLADPAADATRTVKTEREQGLWQRVGEYWWLGLNAKSKESNWTGKHDGTGAVFPPDQDGDYAWSAAFISYVMRIAGAGKRFPYSADHADYINAARRVSLGETKQWLVSAERLQDYAPRLGDLICFGRGSARGLRYEDLPTPKKFTSHCDMVVDTSIPGRIGVIGGNVEDSVALNTVPVTADGKLATPDGVVLDTRFPWMAVLRLLDAAPAA